MAHVEGDIIFLDDLGQVIITWVFPSGAANVRDSLDRMWLVPAARIQVGQPNLFTPHGKYPKTPKPQGESDG